MCRVRACALGPLLLKPKTAKTAQRVLRESPQHAVCCRAVAMTTRNRTSRFESLRSEYKRHRLASGSAMDSNLCAFPDFVSFSATSHDQLVLAVGLQRSLAPEWVDVVDEIQASLRSAKQQSSCFYSCKG